MPHDNRTVVVRVRLTPLEAATLRRLAAQHGITQSAVLRGALGAVDYSIEAITNAVIKEVEMRQHSLSLRN